MSAMQHAVASHETPPSPLVARLVAALLDDGPVDQALLAEWNAPATRAQRERDETHLRQLDWPNLGRYEAANALIAASGQRPELVFMGDSITEIWAHAEPGLFPAHRHVGRGISGQTTAQMLLRFPADVLDLRPRALHLLCGTNDVAGNTGPTTPARYLRHVKAMVDLARGQGIAVLLGLVPPAGAMPSCPGFDPRPWIALLNGHLRDLAQEYALTLLDYHAALDDGSGAMRAAFTQDGVHPNRHGYGAMRAVLTPHLAPDFQVP